MIHKYKVGDVEETYHVDDNLAQNLNGLKDNLRKDYDAFVVVTGKERTGKSTLALQCAKLVDPTFNLTRVVFTPDQFIDAVYNAEKYQAIVYDEAHGGLNSKGTMSTVNKKLIQTFTEMGFRNLYVFLVLPSFFELGRYAAIHRTNLLIHTHERGAYMVFSHRRKKDIYLKGKKTMTIKAPANFKGRYTSHFVVDKLQYEEKKRLSTTETAKEETTFAKKLKEQLAKSLYLLMEKHGYKNVDLCRELDVPANYLGNILYRKDGKVFLRPGIISNFDTSKVATIEGKSNNLEEVLV